MSMGCKSVVYKGDLYWNCIEAGKPVPIAASEVAQIDSSRPQESSSSDWQDLALEELGETLQVGWIFRDQENLWVGG
jgi:hypothetical protein